MQHWRPQLSLVWGTRPERNLWLQYWPLRLQKPFKRVSSWSLKSSVQSGSPTTVLCFMSRKTCGMTISTRMMSTLPARRLLEAPGQVVLLSEIGVQEVGAKLHFWGYLQGQREEKKGRRRVSRDGSPLVCGTSRYIFISLSMCLYIYIYVLLCFCCCFVSFCLLLIITCLVPSSSSSSSSCLFPSSFVLLSLYSSFFPS